MAIAKLRCSKLQRVSAGGMWVMGLP